MFYTVQTLADSGNWAAPWGTDSLHHCDSKAAAEAVLNEWADTVQRLDERRDARALVWCGEWLNDVTDLYPDFELKIGPRHGIQWHGC